MTTSVIHIIKGAIRGGGHGSAAKCARLVGLHPVYHFDRRWVENSGSRSKSGRSGVVRFEITEPGIYEYRALQPEASEGTIGDLQSGIIRVDADGSVHPLSKAEALEILKGA